MTALSKKKTVIGYGNKLNRISNISSINIQSHLKESGYIHKKTIKTELQSAVIDGFTTICL